MVRLVGNILATVLLLVVATPALDAGRARAASAKESTNGASSNLTHRKNNLSQNKSQCIIVTGLESTGSTYLAATLAAIYGFGSKFSFGRWAGQVS